MIAVVHNPFTFDTDTDQESSYLYSREQKKSKNLLVSTRADPNNISLCNIKSDDDDGKFRSSEEDSVDEMVDSIQVKNL